LFIWFLNKNGSRWLLCKIEGLSTDLFSIRKEKLDPFPISEFTSISLPSPSFLTNLLLMNNPRPVLILLRPWLFSILENYLKILGISYFLIPIPESVISILIAYFPLLEVTKDVIIWTYPFWVNLSALPITFSSTYFNLLGSVLMVFGRDGSMIALSSIFDCFFNILRSSTTSFRMSLISTVSLIILSSLLKLIWV